MQGNGQEDTVPKKIKREELIHLGWKMVGLPRGEWGHQIFERNDKRIIWDATTETIVEGEL